MIRNRLAMFLESSRSLFRDFCRIEQPIIECVGAEFQCLAIDMDHHVMVTAADVVLEKGAIRSSRLQSTATAPGDHVNGSTGINGLVIFERPGSLVGVNVSGPDNVNTVLLMQGHHLPDAKIAPGALVGLPEIAVVVLVR